MKDYYHILGIHENASQKEIKQAYRKLAFQHHPDKNPGNEKQAEERFKEINEAYGALGDENKRRQYDYARKSPFAGYGQGGFQYAQQDIFRDTFANEAMFNDLSRMFARAGLRFDRDFLNRVFFQSQGVRFQYYTAPSTAKPVRKPGFIERILMRLATKTGKFIIKRLLSAQSTTPVEQGLDQHMEIEVSKAEASRGSEKRITYKRGTETKKLAVKIPPGVKAGTRIRLKGMGHKDNRKTGDLYLYIRVRS